MSDSSSVVSLEIILFSITTFSCISFGILYCCKYCWRRMRACSLLSMNTTVMIAPGFAPIFPDTCYHLTHYWPAAADIPVASDNPVHYADAIRYNARTPLQGSLLPLTRLV